MNNVCGFLVCLSCKALPLFQDEKSGVAFSPVAQAYLLANIDAVNTDRAKGPMPAANLAASDVHVAQPAPARMCKFSSIYLGRILAYEGQVHTRSFLNILRDRVRSTLNYQM